MGKELKRLSRKELENAILRESQKFEECYFWLEDAMTDKFFEEISHENIMLIAHNLIDFELQEYFCTIHLKHSSIVLCLETPDADLRVLKDYAAFGIKGYQTYISKTAPSFSPEGEALRITCIYFTDCPDPAFTPFSEKEKKEFKIAVKKKEPLITDEEFEGLLKEVDSRFLHALPQDKVAVALEMSYRAKSRDSCQYEVFENKEFENNGKPSLEIVLAWHNVPKQNFLYKLARVIHRHGLMMKGVDVTYVKPYSKDSRLVMLMGLHGINGKAVWENVSLPDFLRELTTIKYFSSFDEIDAALVRKNWISGNMGNMLRAMSNFIHQILVLVDAHLYSLENIIEGLCRHPELTKKLCLAFEYKFDPDNHDLKKYDALYKELCLGIENLDTGNTQHDIRRKNILRQGVNFVRHTLKTNLYRLNYTALAFRLDPKYLDDMPVDRTRFFPELPFAIFYIRGMHFFGYHIRFKDLARGGLRTVIPDQTERMLIERNTVFTECYNLAYTQNMKNKDIPEGGAKGIIFLKPYNHLDAEMAILKRELKTASLDAQQIEKELGIFKQEQSLEHLYLAQRSFINSLLTLVNCEESGRLKAKRIVDYWEKPEYLYLGPDENMHDQMIEWIANYSKKSGYRPGSSFISGKPFVGINHKEYGVTSLGVNIYMEKVLRYSNIDPKKEIFTVKMSGGPDGDVAGNQLCNLFRFFPLTAKLIALTDGTGAIYDPSGVNLNVLFELFKAGKGINYYPPEELNEEAFLIDRHSKRVHSDYIQQTKLWKRSQGKLVESWASSSEVNYLLRITLHQTKADVFIPAGGRPAMLSEENYQDFLDASALPSSMIIIEGANLYLTPGARSLLEKLGCLIVKDSSANKTGVICSSFEVLAGLALGDEGFVENKPILVSEILEKLKTCASNEADLLLSVHEKTKAPLTEISDQISKKIRLFSDQVLDLLADTCLSDDPNDPLILCFLDYCLPFLNAKYQKSLIKEIPQLHKKAIIACHAAANAVYKKGLDWTPPSGENVLTAFLKGL